MGNMTAPRKGASKSVIDDRRQGTKRGTADATKGIVVVKDFTMGFVVIHTKPFD